VRIAGPADPAVVAAPLRALAGRLIPFPGAARVWLATGRTGMRKCMNELALQVQEVLERDPYSGHLFVFRGRRGDLIKILRHDTQGMGLFVKRRKRCLSPILRV
jgi:transposase